MLELITASGNVGIQDIENSYSITHKWDGQDTLHFEVHSDDPICDLLAEEGLIYETTEQQTYVIKGVESGQNEVLVDCSLCLDDWRADAHLSYYNNTSAISTTMSGIVPTGWTMVYKKVSTQRRSVNLPYGATPLDIALEAQNAYSCAMRFDTGKKVCTVYYPYENTLSDTVILPSASMKGRPEYTGTSADLVTRIYPVGAEGLTIESVNNGKAYVENHTYTDKVICQVWQDERYEDAASLKEAAQAMVDSLAVPSAAWEIPLVDLYRADPKKWPNHKVELYQKVRVQNGTKNIIALVTEETIYPYYPDNNAICVNSTPKSIVGTLSGLVESIQNPNSDYNIQHAAAVKNATKLITGSRGGHVVVVLDKNNHPEAICVLSDTDRLSEATSLWRWNEAGLGHSSKGYNGEYALALTKDGAIVADRITVGTLSAGIIKAGILSDKKGLNYWNMDTGEFKLSSTAKISEALDQATVFNKLTNNGALKGIYMQDNVLYINADFLQSGQINAVNISMGGKMAVYSGDTQGGYVGFMAGSDGVNVTDGIGVSDATGENYIIATNLGARMQSGSSKFYGLTNGQWVLDGNLKINGNLEVTGVITSSTESTT